MSLETCCDPHWRFLQNASHPFNACAGVGGKNGVLFANDLLCVSMEKSPSVNIIQSTTVDAGMFFLNIVVYFQWKHIPKI